MIREFKKFLIDGDLVEVAVGLVMTLTSLVVDIDYVAAAAKNRRIVSA